MGLVTPDIGLLFWSLLSFSIVLVILGKFAWKPILTAVKERENSIEEALMAAEKAASKMEALQSDNELLLKQAREERDAILKEARDIKDSIVGEAKGIASTEGAKIIEAARETINNEKMAAITELKNQVATLSINIAEKILRDELSSEEKQKALITTLLDDVNMN